MLTDADDEDEDDDWDSHGTIHIKNATTMKTETTSDTVTCGPSGLITQTVHETEVEDDNSRETDDNAPACTSTLPDPDK